MSLINRKILYDKLMAEGKVNEAKLVIQEHPEMANPKVEETKSTRKKK